MVFCKGRVRPFLSQNAGHFGKQGATVDVSPLTFDNSHIDCVGVYPLLPLPFVFLVELFAVQFRCFEVYNFRLPIPLLCEILSRSLMIPATVFVVALAYVVSKVAPVFRVNITSETVIPATLRASIPVSLVILFKSVPILHYRGFLVSCFAGRFVGGLLFVL